MAQKARNRPGDPAAPPAEPIAQDGGIASMLAQLSGRQSSRRQGWDRGFDSVDTGPRALINPMDSISMSDMAMGADIDEEFPVTAVGGTPRIAMADDGMPEQADYEEGDYEEGGYEGGDDGGDQEADIDYGDSGGGGRLSVQPVQYTRGGTCGPGGCGAPSVFSASPQYQVFDSQPSMTGSSIPGLPPGAQIISERVISGPSVSASASPTQNIVGLQDRLRKIDEGMPPLDQQTLADRAKRAQQRQQAFVDEQGRGARTDVLFQNPLRQAAQAEGYNAEQLFVEHQKMVMAQSNNDTMSEAIQQVRQQAQERHTLAMQKAKMEIAFSPERFAAEAATLRIPGVDPASRAQMVLDEQLRLSVGKEGGKEAAPAASQQGDSNVAATTAATLANPQGRLRQYTAQAHGYDLSIGIVLNFEAGFAPFGQDPPEIPEGATPEQIQEINAKWAEGVVPRAMQDPVFGQALRWYGRPGISDATRAEELYTLRNQLETEFALALTRDQMFSEAPEGGMRWEDVYLNPYAVPKRIRMQAKGLADQHLRMMDTMLASVIQAQKAANPNAGNPLMGVPARYR